MRYKRTPATCHPDAGNHSNGLCLECYNIKRAKYRKEQKIKAKDKIRDYNLSTKYNITLADYNRLLEVQNHCCIICERSHQKLVVDHNHKNGQIRGLLCQSCNIGLGSFKDKIDLLASAIKYLKPPSMDWNYAFKKREINA